MSQEIRKKYSPDSSTVMMRRSHNDMQPSDTVRYMRRKDEGGEARPAPPPYIGQAIPRVKPIRTFQKGTNNSVGENSRPASRRFDTFGENALETIYDQFKFLDESEEAPSAAQTPTSVNSTRPIMAMNHKKRSSRSSRPLLYCVLPILELLAAVAILITSFLTNRKELETRQRSSTDSSDSTLTSEAMHTLSIQNALSTIIPCSFQIMSALFGFWPLFPASKRRAAQILHIAFNSIVIFLWFNAIFDLFFKISMSRILQNPTSDEKYVIDLIYGCFLYFATVILPSITVCVATYHLAISTENQRIFRKSMTAMSVSLGTLLFSLATLIIAIFTAQASLTGDKNLSSDNTSMLAYGLKESIIFVFVLLISIFSLIIATQNRRPLMYSAIIGQGICVLSITSDLFTSDRISAIFNELKTFETSGSVGEIGIVLLNGCAVVSLILLLLQIIVFIFCVSTLSHGSQHSLIVDNNRNPPGRHVERTSF